MSRKRTCSQISHVFLRLYFGWSQNDFLVKNIWNLFLQNCTKVNLYKVSGPTNLLKQIFVRKIAFKSISWYSQKSRIKTIPESILNFKSPTNPSYHISTHLRIYNTSRQYLYSQIFCNFVYADAKINTSRKVTFISLLLWWTTKTVHFWLILIDCHLCRQNIFKKKEFCMCFAMISSKSVGQKIHENVIFSKKNKTYWSKSIANFRLLAPFRKAIWYFLNLCKD